MVKRLNRRAVVLEHNQAASVESRQNRAMEADVAQTTQQVVTALEPAIGRDWSVRAGQLEWDVEFTLEHIASALSKYTLYLASRSKEVIPMRIASWPDISQRERLDAIPSLGRALANGSVSIGL